MADPASDKSAEKSAPAAGKSVGRLLPTILAVVLAPAVSWAVVNFLLLPKITQEVKTQLTAALAQAASPDGANPGAEGSAAAGSPAPKAEAGAQGGKAGAEVRPKFENLTVNIAGTQGTRYLKVTFTVMGKNEAAHRKIDLKHTELVDVTLTILSSLTMPELDDPSSRTVARGRLLAAFNDLLKAPLVEQVLFSDFVVQ